MIANEENVDLRNELIATAACDRYLAQSITLSIYLFFVGRFCFVGWGDSVCYWSGKLEFNYQSDQTKGLYSQLSCLSFHNKWTVWGFHLRI